MKKMKSDHEYKAVFILTSIIINQTGGNGRNTNIIIQNMNEGDSNDKHEYQYLKHERRRDEIR